MVMTEALACGTPVVTDAMGAAPEIVKDGDVGIVVGAGEWDDMVAAIKSGRLDAIDPSHCREYVLNHFGVQAMIAGYEAAFEKIVAAAYRR